MVLYSIPETKGKINKEKIIKIARLHQIAPIIFYGLKNSGLKMCIEYPAYTFENAAYHVFFENFLTQNSPEFLILRKNESVA